MATIVNNYTLLPVQVAGVLAAAVVLVMLLRVPRVAAVPTVATIILGLVAVTQLFSGAGAFDGVRRDLSSVGPGTTEREKCLVAGGNEEMIAFGRWLAQRIPDDATFRYVSSGFDRPCFQYSLLPRRMVSGPAPFTVYANPQDPESQQRLARERKRPVDERRIEFYSQYFGVERTG